MSHTFIAVQPFLPFYQCKTNIPVVFAAASWQKVFGVCESVFTNERQDRACVFLFVLCVVKKIVILYACSLLIKPLTHQIPATPETDTARENASWSKIKHFTPKLPHSSSRRKNPTIH